MENKNTPVIGNKYREISAFTLRVYFKNSEGKNGHSFHSWKQETRKINGFQVTDERYALNRLTWLVEELYNGKYKTAILYHNPTGEALMQWNYGTLKEKKRYSWIIDTNGNTRIKLTPNDVTDPQKTIQFLNKTMNYKF